MVVQFSKTVWRSDPFWPQVVRKTNFVTNFRHQHWFRVQWSSLLLTSIANYSLQLTSNIKLFLIGHSMTKIQLSCYLLWTACNCIKITKTFQMYCHPSFIWTRFKIIRNRSVLVDVRLYSEQIQNFRKSSNFEIFHFQGIQHQKPALLWNFEPPTRCVGVNIHSSLNFCVGGSTFYYRASFWCRIR